MSSFPGEALQARINELEKILDEKEEKVVEYLAKIEELENYIIQLENRINEKQKLVSGPSSEEDLSYKEQILNILKSKASTSKELARLLNISERDTRTYLLRLKNEDRIRIVEKIGRSNVYTYKMPYGFEKRHTKVNALEYDLSYLLNLIEMKMSLKEGVTLSPSDLLTIKRIKERLEVRKEDITKGMEILQEFVDYEQDYKDEIKEKISELEARINGIDKKN